MFTTLVMRDAIAHEGRLCRPDYLTVQRGRAGRRPGGGPAPLPLILWRNKLRASDRPERIFEAVREVISTSGVISNKTRRALDSTVLEDAVQRQDTISLLQSQIRRVRKLIGELAERVYVRQHNLGPGRPPCDFEDRDDIDRLISELVDDAYELVFAAEDVALELDEQQQDALIARIAEARQEGWLGEVDGLQISLA
jgi:hypothetical protein